MIRRSLIIILIIIGIGTFDFASYAQDNVAKGATITVELSEAAAAERKPIEGAEIKLISGGR